MWFPASALPGATDFEALTMVRFEPVRSAEPPRSSGSSGTRTSSTFCDALRVARVSPLEFRSSMRDATRSSNSVGRAAAMRRWNSAGSVGNSLEYFLKSDGHFYSALAPVSPAARPARTASGISKGGYGQPMAVRVAATSSPPKADPCAAPVLAFLGAPFAMTVLQQMSVGRLFERLLSLFALRMARSTASTSCPATFGMTCHPYGPKRLGTSSVYHSAIWPLSESIEMPLSS